MQRATWEKRGEKKGREFRRFSRHWYRSAAIAGMWSLFFVLNFNTLSKLFARRTIVYGHYNVYLPITFVTLGSVTERFQNVTERFHYKWFSNLNGGKKVSPSWVSNLPFLNCYPTGRFSGSWDRPKPQRSTEKQLVTPSGGFQPRQTWHRSRKYRGMPPRVCRKGSCILGGR